MNRINEVLFSESADTLILNKSLFAVRGLCQGADQLRLFGDVQPREQHQWDGRNNTGSHNRAPGRPHDARIALFLYFTA